MPDESGKCANCGGSVSWGWGCNNECVSSYPTGKGGEMNKGDSQSEKNRKEYLKDGITEKEREKMDIVDRLAWLFKGKRPKW